MKQYELGDRVWTHSHGPGTVVKLPDKDELYHVYVDTYSHIGTYSDKYISPLAEYNLKLAHQKAFDMMRPLREHVESIECGKHCRECPLSYASSICIVALINELFEYRFD